MSSYSELIKTVSRVVMTIRARVRVPMMTSAAVLKAGLAII